MRKFHTNKGTELTIEINIQNVSANYLLITMFV